MIKLLRAGFEFIMDILETIVFIGSLFIVVYLFIMQPNQVKGASMDPTFNSGDYIFTSKITYKIRAYQRGDVVVFKSPKNPDIEYIKRIIGLPGDQIVIKDTIVSVNGTVLNEGYISDKTNLWDGGYVKNGEPVKVPPGELFVMGDNRPRSSDSREFGSIPMSSIIGHVFYRYFPSSKVGPIKNPYPVNLRGFLFRINKNTALFS
jgi:signal peptidase I